MKHELLTFEDKYLGGSKGKGIKTSSKMPTSMSNSEFEIPANISEEMTKEIYEMSVVQKKHDSIPASIYLTLKKTDIEYVDKRNS